MQNTKFLRIENQPTEPNIHEPPTGSATLLDLPTEILYEIAAYLNGGDLHILNTAPTPEQKKDVEALNAYLLIGDEPNCLRIGFCTKYDGYIEKPIAITGDLWTYLEKNNRQLHIGITRERALLEIIEREIKKAKGLIKHPLRDVIRFAQVNRQLYGLFHNPKCKYNIKQQILNILLLHVVRGEQDEAKKILEHDFGLMLKKGDVTDYSGRTFKNISPFQYTLWALDWHMWRMLLDCIPEGQEKIYYPKLLRQYDILDKLGVEYTLFSTTKCEKHYDFILLNALHACYDNFYQVTLDQNIQDWHNVGFMQRLVPMHVAQEYLRHDRSFANRPTFYDHSLPRTDKDSEDCSWFPLKDDLGSKYGYTRNNHPRASLISKVCLSEFGTFDQSDLHAMQALKEMRLQNFADLKKQLITLQKPRPPSPKREDQCTLS